MYTTGSCHHCLNANARVIDPAYVEGDKYEAECVQCGGRIAWPEGQRGFINEICRCSQCEGFTAEQRLDFQARFGSVRPARELRKLQKSGFEDRGDDPDTIRYRRMVEWFRQHNYDALAGRETTPIGWCHHCADGMGRKVKLPWETFASLSGDAECLTCGQLIPWPEGQVRYLVEKCRCYLCDGFDINQKQEFHRILGSNQQPGYWLRKIGAAEQDKGSFAGAAYRKELIEQLGKKRYVRMLKWFREQGRL